MGILESVMPATYFCKLAAILEVDALFGKLEICSPSAVKPVYYELNFGTVANA